VGTESVERRARKRFPLRLDLRFNAGRGGRHRIPGAGEVVNVSSQGVAFRTATALEPDWSISASMEWPVRLNGDCILRVAMEGRILRVEPNLCVMSVERYEFRTCGRVAAPQVQEVDVLKRQLDGMLSVSATGMQAGL